MRITRAGFLRPSAGMEMNVLNPKAQNHATAGKISSRKGWVWAFALLSVGGITIYVLLNTDIFSGLGTYLKLVRKLVLVATVAFAILMLARLLERAVPNRHPAARYNLIRLIRLVAVLMIAVAAASLLFENWYTAAVSLGLFSLLLGFALQTPITSLIGWLYIVIRTPYRVGERIQINDFKGDVMEIGYLDTTLWEFAGSYLTNDLPSGRLIRFPNSLVLQAAVFNYSWSKFPFLWNEIPFHIAYESDLGLIESVIKRVTTQELDQAAEDKVKDLRDYMSQTPVSEIDIKSYPFVSFRINTNTWVEATVTYLVDPKKAADTRSRIIKEVLRQLLVTPDKALFPKSNAR